MDEELFMTQKGYDEAQAKLKYLQITKRAEITERIKIAREFGDLSENAEYDAAKNEQAAIEGEIAILEDRLKRVKIIEEKSIKGVVNIGSVVKVFDYDMEENDEYTITGAMEADALNNKISNSSPVGQALMGSKVGDVVTVNAPGGSFKMKVLEIK